MKVGGVTIRLANTKVFAGYTIRRLQLKKVQSLFIQLYEHPYVIATYICLHGFVHKKKLVIQFYTQLYVIAMYTCLHSICAQKKVIQFYTQPYVIVTYICYTICVHKNKVTYLVLYTAICYSHIHLLHNLCA